MFLVDDDPSTNSPLAKPCSQAQHASTTWAFDRNMDIMGLKQPRKTSFLDLPPEIRISIYDVVLPDQVDIWFNAYYPELAAPPAFKYCCSTLSGRSEEAKWLQLSHQIRAEYCHELSRRRFVIRQEDDHGRHAGRQIPSWLRSAMQNVRIETLCISQFGLKMPKYPNHFLMSRSLEQRWQLSQLSGNSRYEVKKTHNESPILLDDLRLKKLTLDLHHPSVFEFTSCRHHVTCQLPVALSKLLYDALQQGSIQELQIIARKGPRRFMEHLLRILGLRQMMDCLPFAETDSLVEVLYTDKSDRSFRVCFEQLYQISRGTPYHTTNIRMKTASRSGAETIVA